MKSKMNAEPLRISAKAKTIAVIAIFVAAIFAAAFSVSVLSSTPVKVIPLAGGTAPTTSMKLTNGTPVVKGWNTTKVVMNLTAARGGTDNDDRIRGIWYKLDAWNTTSAAWDLGTWVNYTKVNKTVNITTQGTVRINYNASDYLDNEATKLKTIFVDTVAPTATATVTTGTAASNGWYKSNVTVLITTTNDTLKYRNTSGLNSTSYKIGTGSAVTKIIKNETEKAAGVNITVSAQGSNNVTYWSSDNATNKVEKNLIVKIDSVAPVLSLPADASTLTDLWFNWTATDASSGIDHYMVSVDGATAVSNTNGSIKLTGGAHDVNVTAVDVAGNQATKSVNVTATAPAGGLDMTMIIIIVVIIVVVIALVAVMMMRKGKKGAVAEEAPAAEEKS